ncbi:hypothetical protein BDP55DRAFT_757678 [Colletotrichum godetiae]|uniref:Uncharacterized protein n=1 Tax=Colletotrichum godetiae TaxID=1209918 RepID=A0AAJ0ASR4_9PEZI|nr:uncharacterized protein BDP55DRAFT_757678 [Colletotrichum godetiae]KAK1689692.1 hypothetical protein BDP55DRAFT_757678 [Colletotrichum godetiae]
MAYPYGIWIQREKEAEERDAPGPSRRASVGWRGIMNEPELQTDRRKESGLTSDGSMQQCLQVCTSGTLAGEKRRGVRGVSSSQHPQRPQGIRGLGTPYLFVGHQVPHTPNPAVEGTAESRRDDSRHGREVPETPKPPFHHPPPVASERDGRHAGTANDSNNPARRFLPSYHVNAPVTSEWSEEKSCTLTLLAQLIGLHVYAYPAPVYRLPAGGGASQASLYRSLVPHNPIIINLVPCTAHRAPTMGWAHWAEGPEASRGRVPGHISSHI